MEDNQILFASLGHHSLTWDEIQGMGGLRHYMMDNHNVNFDWNYCAPKADCEEVAEIFSEEEAVQTIKKASTNPQQMVAIPGDSYEDVHWQVWVQE